MVDVSNPDDISYERARELARSDDVAVRAALAEREDLAPELLYFLAEDDSAAVRKAVAVNEAAPRQTDLLLAQDDDEEVRGGLAAKIAHIAPGLTEEESNKVRAQTYEALETLAHDQITKVRALLSDALKDVIDAPPGVIKVLAADLSIEVSGPILEHSPVLTDDDLIEIIQNGPAQGGVSAIARRSEVSENLSDAIIGSDDIGGISDLLSNNSAQIREEALDDLIDRSEHVDLWQAPLVARTKLPDGAAERMAGFIAENFLETLSKRDDFDQATMASVSEIVRNRISNQKKKKTLAASFDFLTVETPIDAASRLMDAEKLTDDVIVKALQAGDHPFVFAALLVRSGVSEAVGRRIFNERSPYGIVALVGKAGLPVSMIMMVQQQMGRIAPTEIIEPPDEEDAFPMGPDDIDWHLEFFANMVERG